MRKLKNALYLGLLLLTAGSACADNLYQGEKRISVNGYPAITRYFPGDPKRPLVVFSPGAHHTARIAYGGPGTRQEDFLAFWLNKLGYNFLAVSYPIVTKSEFIDSKPTPAFNAQNWGQQVAAAAKATTEENKLSGHVVLLNWSMAGKVIQPAFKATSEAGLTVDGAISMAATPGLTGLLANLELKKTSDGYADRKASYSGWLNQIKVNSAANDGREIIPEALYRSDYVGDIPVALEGFGEVFRNGKFEFDLPAQANDFGAFDFANQPLIAILQSGGALDAEHALVDRHWWGIYNAETLFTRVKNSGVDFSKIDPQKWQKIKALSTRISNELTIPADENGNHFAFVGEKGASKMAASIDQAIRNLNNISTDLSAVLK